MRVRSVYLSSFFLLSAVVARCRVKNQSLMRIVINGDSCSNEEAIWMRMIIYATRYFRPGPQRGLTAQRARDGREYSPRNSPTASLRLRKHRVDELRTESSSYVAPQLLGGSSISIPPSGFLFSFCGENNMESWNPEQPSKYLGTT